MKKFVIIDGNAIIHRAYHAIPPLTTKNGVMVNAVFGFASMLLRVWNDLKPEYIAVAFDMAGGTFRHEQYKEYKATRVKADQALYDQIPLVHQLVEAFNIPIFEKKGFEADDLIGTVVTKVQTDDNLEIYIVTGDKDTIQLVNERVKVYTLKKGINDIAVYDIAAVQERFGFGPERMVDFKALAGDASDNIPGVPGIGEKTATDLIQQFGGIAEIYHHLRTLPAQGGQTPIKSGVLAKLQAGEDSARMSFALATIDCHVPEVKVDLEKCRAQEFDRDSVSRLFQEYEFMSLLKRVPGMGGGAESEKRKVRSDKDSSVRSGEQKKIVVKFHEVASQEEAKQVVQKIKKAKCFAVRPLWNGTDMFVVPLQEMVVVVEEQAYWIKQSQMIAEIFVDPAIELVGHDVKMLLKLLRVQGVELHNTLFDVMIASYLLNPGSRAHDIASILFKVLGVVTKAASAQGNLFGADPRLVAEEAMQLLVVAKKLRADLEENNNLGLFTKIEMPLIPVLADMEYNGIAVDSNKLAQLADEVKNEIEKITKKIFEMAGMEFNISSPIQLREVLFEKLDIPVEGIKKGKTGLSTASAELDKMRGLHPIIDEIETYRELTKLQNTYIDVLPTLINQKTKRIHTTFNQAVAATGRLSSSDPNLQNIPVRTALGREIRSSFIAEAGNILVSADYSQIELRIVASLAKDKKMMEIFARGEDIHRATAAAIHGVALEEVTKEMRYSAKEVNFGVLYGMGAFGLSSRTGITNWQAKEFIEKYFHEFSGVKKYIDQTLAFARETGYCETLFGRRRYIPELNAKNFQLRAAAERMAVNHPIQGTAADLMKMAMVSVKLKVESGKFEKDNVKMILQVHDELVLEVQKGLEEQVGEMVKQTMEQVVTLNVPVLVDVHYNQNWGDIK